MRRALVVVSLWLGLAVVSTGVGLATVGVLQQRVGEAVSRPLTSAEVSAALDNVSETVPPVPGLSRPDEDDADDRSASPTATRAVTYAPAGGDDDEADHLDDSTSRATTPRPAVTADPTRSTGSGSGSSTRSSDGDGEETDREDTPSQTPRPSRSEREDDDRDRPSSSSTERSGRELARRAAGARRTTTVAQLHRARVTVTPHRHHVRLTVRHRGERGSGDRPAARVLTRR